MRRRIWSCAMPGLIALGIVFAAAASAAHAQMCTPAIRDCESQADAEAERCSLQCARYDTICADCCDDTHDIIVHYCWIRRALCKASDESRGFVKASSDQK